MSSIGWVFGVLRQNGIDTKGMSAEEAFDELEKLRQQERDNHSNGSNDKVKLHNKLTNKEWENSLTPQQKQSARDYSSFGQVWNRNLWDGQQVDNESIKLFDSLIESYELKEPITVYRNMPTNRSSDEDFISLGYVSTSIDKEKTIKDASKGYKTVHIYEVSAGKGKGAYINNMVAPNYKDVEYEFVLKRGTKCTKLDKYEDNGVTYIKWRV